MAQVIVTGGAGFIGSHLVEALVASRHTVTVIDDLSSGKRENVPGGVELVREDIRSPRMKDIWRDVRPQYVFHLAAQKNIRTSFDRPLYDADINISGSLNIIEQSRRFGVKKFIFSSTAGVYADTRQLPLRESARCLPPSPYGLGKYTIEQYLNFFRMDRTLSSVSLRYANVYGPRQDPAGEAGVIATFMDRIRRGEPLKINGHGRQTRDYVFVGDIVRANILAMKRLIAQGEINIGTAKQTSVNVLAAAIVQISGRRVKIQHRAAVTGEVQRNALHAGLAKKLLGWSPAVQLRDGLGQTWATEGGV